jgi:hypothetical protein
MVRSRFTARIVAQSRRELKCRRQAACFLQGTLRGRDGGPYHTNAEEAMFRTRIFVFVLGGALGAFAGAAAMLIAFPYLFPPPAANEAPPVPIATVAASHAAFAFDVDAPGRDPAHWANGHGSIVRTPQGPVPRLESDFESGPGPNYWLYLNTRPIGEESDFKADARRVRLGWLKSFKGAQNYFLPAGIDPAHFHSVTIWCETFGACIGNAVLRQR